MKCIAMLAKLERYSIAYYISLLSLGIRWFVMTDAQLFAQIASLPADLKKEVSDLVAFLKRKSAKERKIKERQFGYSKGFFKNPG